MISAGANWPNGISLSNSWNQATKQRRLRSTSRRAVRNVLESPVAHKEIEPGSDEAKDAEGPDGF